MSTTMKLADDQRFALMKLRRNVQDVMQPHHDDQYLVKWLQARKWDPAAAEKMLRNSLEWRKKWNVDNVLEWTEPEVLRNYLPFGVCGFDEEGSQVAVLQFGAVDFYGVLSSATQEDLIKLVIKYVETLMKTSVEQEKKYGPAAYSINVIFDMEGFNLREIMWRPAGEVIITLIQFYEANYPELLKICYIVNAPKVFAFAFAVVKRFMNDYTLSKIQIYKPNPAKWQAAIFKSIPKNQVPAHYGGTLRDPDGNPRYHTKINRGGKVPKHFYRTDTNKNTEDYTTVIVRKGDKLKIDFDVTESGGLLSWDFRTEGHDIKFGIERKDAEGSLAEVLPLRRVHSNQVDEIGIMTCDTPAKYSVVFDNSYSVWRNKKLSYCVRFLPPGEENDLTVTKVS